MDVANAVFSGLSALASIIQAYVAARQYNRSLTADDIQAIDNSAQKTAVASPAAERLRVIDDDVLEVIRKNIDKAKDRLKKDLGDPQNSNAQKDHAIEIANSTICAELSRIKRLNGGRLPGQEYNDWWASHGCS